MSLTRRNFAALGLGALAASTLGLSPALAGSRSGKFKGASGHVSRGTVTVKKSGGKSKVILSKDFFFDGAPDPKITFGKGGKYVKGTKIHNKLSKRNWKGGSTHNVPSSIDTDKFDTVVIWCERFSVPLAVARL